MSVTRWERSNTWKTTVEWKSGSTYIDPSGNISTLDVYKADGTHYISHSGVRDCTGIYHYYVSTSNDDPLGLWIVDWNGLFTHEDTGTTNWIPKHDKEVVELVYVIQS